MTVQSQTSSINYNGPGAAFAIPFRFLADTDIRIIKTPAGSDVPITLVLTTDYTLTGARQQSGGEATLTTPLISGDKLLIDRGNLPLTQLIDYRANDPFPEEDAEDGLDRLTMSSQQLNDRLNKTFSLPPSVLGVSVTLPTPQPLLPLVWNSTATAIENGSTTLTGDMLLRPNLADDDSGKGTDLIAARAGVVSVPYLQTLSDILNGEVLPIMRFIQRSQIVGIKNRTTTYNATADLQAALGSGAKGLDWADGLFRIGSTLTLDSASNMTLRGSGAALYIDAATTGLVISNCDSLNVHGELNLIGLNTATGFSLSGNINCDLSGLRVSGLALGGILGTPGNKSFGGISVPARTRVANFTAIGCADGLRVDGEYYELVSPHIEACSRYGLHVRGGNFSVTGGVINGNRIGVFVEGGVIGNSDHGKIVGTTMNHNLAAGVYIKDTDYSFHLTGCDIWATIGDGTANGQLTEAGRTTSFGVYLQNANNVNLSGNVVARNRVNVGIDGACLCDFSASSFMADPARTTDHILEYGANNTTYSANAQNNYTRGCVFEGTLSGAHQRRVTTLQTSASIANDCGGSLGTTGDNTTILDGSVAGTQVWEGHGDILYLTSTCPATVQISPALFQRNFQIQFVSVSGGSKQVVFIAQNGLASYSSAAVVSGSNVTLKANLLYTFASNGNGIWTITSSGGSEAAQVIGAGGAPAFQNSWSALATFTPPRFYRNGDGDVVVEGVLSTSGASNAVAFTLPAGYRPTAIEAGPLACGASLTGFLRIETNGDVKPNYEATATFCAMKTVFRPA